MSKTDKIEPEIKRALLELSVGYDYEEKEILGEKKSDNPKIKIIKKTYSAGYGGDNNDRKNEAAGAVVICNRSNR